MIRFQFGGGGGAAGGGASFLFDNIVVTAIPEPGTLALLGMAAGVLLYHRRRK